MTQSIIPGCEANPDPATVINVDPTKPMKEINMNETKSNAMDNADIPESFKAFLATGSSVIETCRELLAENQRLRKMVEQRNEIMNVLTRHFNDGELGDICSSLDGKLTLLGCFEDTIDKFKIEDVDHLHSSLQALEAYAKAAGENTQTTRPSRTSRARWTPSTRSSTLKRTWGSCARHSKNGRT